MGSFEGFLALAGWATVSTLLATSFELFFAGFDGRVILNGVGILTELDDVFDEVFVDFDVSNVFDDLGFSAALDEVFDDLGVFDVFDFGRSHDFGLPSASALLSLLL